MPLQIISSVAMLFLMMIPGIVMKKCRLSGDGFGKGLSNLVLFIASPALILNAYMRPYSPEIMTTAIQIFLFSILSHTVFSIVAFLSFRGAENELRKILRFSVIFANAAYMGMPLIEASMGGEAVLYASIYNIGFNIFQWSLGVRIFKNDEKLNVLDIIKKVLIHPCTLASILGIIMFVTPADSYVPEIIEDAVVMLKNLVAPLSMLIIGLRLAEIDFPSVKSTLRDKYVWLALSLRHFLMPALIFAVLKLLSLIFPISQTAILVITILTSAPVATATVMFSERYDSDAKYSSKIVTVSTLLSILTMPLVILLTEI